MHIGFIGLGNMGAPMARNLVKAGHRLTVFDLSTVSVAQVCAAGGQAAESAQAVAEAGPELLITMLPGPQQVRKVYLGKEGLLAHTKSGMRFVDCSTIDPQTSREVAAAAVSYGHSMLDAPVSGGTGGAEAATLTFMVGGSTSDFDAVKPVLAAMGKNIVHCGGAGNGQVAKVANNMLLGISMIGASEAMSLGVALGMEPKVLAEIINTSSGRCWSTDTYNPYPGVNDNAPAARGYSGGFESALMLKDLGLAIEAASHVKQPVLLGAVAQQLYQAFNLQGHGKLDFSAIIKTYTREAA
jgi:3-hydroxyisobutyrate dehydrogenase